MIARFTLISLVFTLSFGATASAADCFQSTVTRECIYKQAEPILEIWCMDDGLNFYPFPAAKDPNGKQIDSVRCGHQVGNPSIVLLYMHKILLDEGLSEEAIIKLLKSFKSDTKCGEFPLIDVGCAPPSE